MYICETLTKDVEYYEKRKKNTKGLGEICSSSASDIPHRSRNQIPEWGDLEDWWDDIEQWEKDNQVLLYPLQIAQERKREGYKRIDKKLQCFIPDWEAFMKNHTDPKTATKYLNDVIQIIQNMENITLNFKGNGVWAVMKVVPQVLVTETKMLNK